MKQPEIVQKAAINIIGVTTRTRNQDEVSSRTARIPALWARFQQVQEYIPNKANPNCILALYSDYESDEQGLYSETVGFEVTSLAHVPEGMVAKTAPASTYAVFTSPWGSLPDIVLATWQEIWTWQAAQGKRSFSGDFELYDQRSANPQHAQIDIYVAIQ